MKKILLVVVFTVVFLATFFLIFFTGNNNNADQSDESTENGTDNETVSPYDYDLSEYVTLGEFPKVTVDQTRVDELIAGTVKSIASNFAETKDITDRPVQDGDTVNIDYIGTVNGVAFEGGTAKGADLTIGSGNFIKGFEEGLIGKSIGEEVVLQLEFPNPYHNTELQGKAVVFTVKINKITENIIPELTDAMIVALRQDDYSTVAEFNAYIKKLATENVIWESYLDSCEIKKHPEKEIEKYKNQITENYKSQAAYYNMTLESLVSAMGYSSMEQFNSDVLESVKDSVGAEMVVYQTVRVKNIKVTDEEYKKYGLAVAKENSYSTLEKMEKAVDKNYITLSVYQKKIIAMAYQANGLS